MRFKCFKSLSLAALAAIAASATDEVMSNIVQWVRSEGGYFNDKIEIRRVDPNDSSSFFGVFANSAIDAQEILMGIPQECYIDIFDEAKDTEIEDWNQSISLYHKNMCMLCHKLITEMKLGDESQFAPYVAYLKTQKPGQLPVNWSEAGKNLLRHVLKPGSDGVDWIDKYYLKSHSELNCIVDDPFEIHMMEITVQRSYDTALIPIWDMVNHDNGRINTESNSMYDKEGLQVRAAKAIKAGEEIFASYDKCLDCSDLEDFWGTPEILRDFGFVEAYPHRWVFDDEEDIWFEIKENPLDKKLWVDFYATDSDDGIPDEDEISYLQDELDRLSHLQRNFTLNHTTTSMPSNEYATIMRFYQAAKDDLQLAVDEAVKNKNSISNFEL